VGVEAPVKMVYKPSQYKRKTKHEQKQKNRKRLKADPTKGAVKDSPKGWKVKKEKMQVCRKGGEKSGGSQAEPKLKEREAGITKRLECATGEACSCL